MLPPDLDSVVGLFKRVHDTSLLLAGHFMHSANPYLLVEFYNVAAQAMLQAADFPGARDLARSRMRIWYVTQEARHAEYLLNKTAPKLAVQVRFEWPEYREFIDAVQGLEERSYNSPVLEVARAHKARRVRNAPPLPIDK